MAKARRVSLSELGEAVANKEEIVGHNTRAGAGVTGGFRNLLPSQYQEKMRADNPNYVVVHHATPIAWHGESGWVVPDVKYSSTTSRRQNAIRRSINAHFTDAHNNARS